MPDRKFWMLIEQVSGNRLRLCRASEVPKGCNQRCLRGKPPPLAFQDPQTNIAGSCEIAQMKPRPSFVDPGLVDFERAQSLRLLLVRGGLAKVARVTVKHPRHM